MKRNWLLSITLLAAILSANLGNSLRHRARLEEKLPLAPNIQFLERWNMGLGNALAMGYWLTMLSTIGGWLVDQKNKSEASVNRAFSDPVNRDWLKRYLETVTRLAPEFPEPYLYGGIMLHWYARDLSGSTAFLKKGWEAKIDKWEIPFYLSFNATREGRHEEASMWARRAADHPKAPAIATLVATGLLAKVNQPEVGLAMLDALLLNLPKAMEPFKVLLEADRTLQFRLVTLNRAAKIYEERHGKPARRVEQLLHEGLITRDDMTPTQEGYFSFSGDRVIFTAKN